MRRLLDQAGVTLLELLMAMSIATIVLTLGASSLSGLVARNAVTAAANHLLGFLNTARTRSITLGHVVAICPWDFASGRCDLPDATTWNSTAIAAAVDSDRNGIYDRPIQLYKVAPVFGVPETPELLEFNADGATNLGGNLTITLCGTPKHEAKQVVVAPVGRAWVRSATAEDCQ